MQGCRQPTGLHAEELGRNLGFIRPPDEHNARRSIMCGAWGLLRTLLWSDRGR